MIHPEIGRPKPTANNKAASKPRPQYITPNKRDLTSIIGLRVNPIKKKTQRRSACERSAKYHKALPHSSETTAAPARNMLSVNGLRIAWHPPGQLEKNDVLQHVAHDGKPDAL